MKHPGTLKNSANLSIATENRIARMFQRCGTRYQLFDVLFYKAVGRQRCLYN